MKNGYVYIVTNRPDGVLYIGVTSNLSRRIEEHKNKRNPQGFTARYHCNRLVWYTCISGMSNAISEEKRLKNWRRQWKIDLIEKEDLC